MSNFIKTIVPCVAALLIAIGQAPAADLYMNSQTGAEGGVVRFDLNIGNAPNDVAAFGFEVEYDATVLSFQRFDPGPLVGAFTNFNVNNTGFGQIRIGGFDIGEHIIPAGESGFLVGLTFRVSGQKDSELAIRELMDDMKTWTAGNGIFIAEKEDGEEENQDESETVDTDDDEPEQNEEIVPETGDTGRTFEFRQTDSESADSSTNFPEDSSADYPMSYQVGGYESGSNPVRGNSTVREPGPSADIAPRSASREKTTGNFPESGKKNQKSASGGTVKTSRTQASENNENKPTGTPVPGPNIGKSEGALRLVGKPSAPAGEPRTQTGESRTSTGTPASISISPVAVILIAALLIQVLILVRIRMMKKERSKKSRGGTSMS